MYYIYTRSGDYKAKTIKESANFLDLSGIGDLGGMRRDLRGNDKAWYNDGEGCGVERQDGRALREIPYVPW